MSYYLAFIVNFSLALLEKKIKDKDKKKLFYISFIFIFLFLGGGYNIGADWLNYYYNYNYINTNFNTIKLNIPEWIDFEIGFQYYTALLKTFLTFDNYLVVSKFIDIICIYIFSKRYTKYTCIFIFVFFGISLYALEIEAMRQVKAILLLIYSIKYFDQKKFFKYSITIILASFFHKTIIIFILLYFFKDMKINKKNIYIYIALIVVLSFVFINIIEILVLRVNFLNKYIVYLEGYYSSKKSFTLFNLIRNIIFIFPYLIVLNYQDELSKKIQKFETIKFLSFVYLVFFLATNFMILFERFTLYFSFFYFIGWTFIFYLKNRNSLKILMFIFYTFISLRQTIMLSRAVLIKDYKNIFIDSILDKNLNLEERVKNNNIFELGKIHQESIEKK